MIRRRSVVGFALGLAAPLGLLAALAGALAAQAAPRPQPYCIRGVALDRSGAKKGTLILRDGAISAILDEAAPAPPGTRVIEGAGLICLPAFLDAFSRQGCTVPEPVKDQDLPPNEQADVGIDMRLANRKGIEPGFRAVEALAITKEQSEAWRKNGFGAVLVAPGGELLAGSSALATTREAAMRDLVVREDVFAHAAFNAAGPGYPSTLMGYFAQLRQFLIDSQRQVELTRRYEEGRPGTRPPFDRQLDAGALLVAGRRTLLCEAQGSADMERWLRLADEFGVHVAFAGGLEAWRVADVLVQRAIPVVLTLDWGKEVKDPRPKTDEKKPDADKAGEKKEQAPESAAGETKPDEAKLSEAKPDALKPEAAKADEAKPAEAASAKQEPGPNWEYDEPYAVRLERRRKWEEGRDCALRLHEAGAHFVFGSASGKPDELLAHVRTLVKGGLPADDALAALTSAPAALLGVEQRLGRVAVGADATFTLWRADPLTDEKASAAWIFVDGFPSEFKLEEKKAGGAPSEGLDASGTWQVEFKAEGDGPKAAVLVLEMAKDGKVSGTLTVDSPMDGSKVKADVDGQLSKDQLELECTLDFGQFKIGATLTATLAGDALDGEGSFKVPEASAPMKQTFHAKRTPK